MRKLTISCANFFTAEAQIPRDKKWRSLSIAELINYTSQFDIEYHIHNSHMYDTAGQIGLT